MLERSPTRWRIASSARRPATLVVANATFPGWIARVDGARAPILSHEGEPFAIPVPEGRHEVLLEYRPLSFRLGLASALAATLAAAVLGWRLSRA